MIEGLARFLHAAADSPAHAARAFDAVADRTPHENIEGIVARVNAYGYHAPMMRRPALVPVGARRYFHRPILLRPEAN